MTGRLNGKTAIITGGGQGIGQAVSSLFAREGANVLITGRTASKLEATVEAIKAGGGTATCLVADAGVRSDADAVIARTVEIFGGIDILVNNAQASFPGTPFEETNDEIFDITLSSGLYATYYHCQAALPYLRKNGGSIINLGSRNGIYGAAEFSAYAAAKEGIRGLTRSLAREFGKYQIRANVICPAALSPISSEYLRTNPDIMAEHLREISLGRFGDCDKDVAPVFLFLASDDSRYVSGQTINVDGGMEML